MDRSNTVITMHPDIGRWVLLATITASSMVFIDGAALNVALNALQLDLHASGAQLIWIVNAYVLVLAALILIGGSLGDHFGRNRIFRIGIVIFSASSFVCGISPTVEILIGARAVQGLGGALMVPGSLAIISASFPADKRGQAIGTWSSFGTITTIVAPALGGYLAGAGLWRGVFFINIPLAIVSVFALSRVPETKDEHVSPQFDYPGIALITLGLAGLTYGTIALGQANSAGTSDPIALAAVIGGIVALGAFVLVEAKSTHPIVPLRLFRNRTFSGTNLMTLFLYGALSGALFFFPLNLIQIQGYDANIAGLAFIPFVLILAALSPLMGRLVSRVGPRLLLTIGPLIVGGGFFVLGQAGLTSGPPAYWTTYFPGIILIGLGMGITVAPLSTAVMGAVSSQEAGIASGVNNAVTRSAQGLAVAIFGALALATFSTNLVNRAAASGVSPANQQQIRQSANKLGNTDIPAGLDVQAQASVKQAIQLSFIDTFRLMMDIGTGLAVLSALAAAALVENRLSAPDRSKTDETA